MVARPKVEFVRRDLGLSEMKRTILSFAGKRVNVGILQSAGEVDGVHMATIAAVHEFGSEDGRIPQRSFLRSALHENREKIAKLMADASKAVLLKKISAAQALHVIGAGIKAFVQRKITVGPFAPLKPATIRRKGSSRPLIDKGNLRRVVDYEIEGGAL